MFQIHPDDLRVTAHQRHFDWRWLCTILLPDSTQTDWREETERARADHHQPWVATVPHINHKNVSVLYPCKHQCRSKSLTFTSMLLMFFLYKELVASETGWISERKNFYHSHTNISENVCSHGMFELKKKKIFFHPQISVRNCFFGICSCITIYSYSD